MRAALVDVSRYQGMIDGSRIKAAGFCGIIARCTIGFAEDGTSVGKGLEFYRNSQKQARVREADLADLLPRLLAGEARFDELA